MAGTRDISSNKEFPEHLLVLGSADATAHVCEILANADIETKRFRSVAALEASSSLQQDLESTCLVICAGSEARASQAGLPDLFASQLELSPPPILFVSDGSMEIPQSTNVRQGATASISSPPKSSELIIAVNDLLSSDYAILYRTAREQRRRIATLQKKIERQNRKLHSFVDTASDVLAFVSTQGKIIICNKSVEQFFGLNRDELIGKPIRVLFDRAREQFESPAAFDDLIHRLERKPDANQGDSQAHKEFLARALKTNAPLNRYVSVFSVTIQSDDPDSSGRLWGMSDVTDLKQAEEQLRTVVDASPIPLIVTRLSDGRIIYANRHIAEMMGLTPEELLGKKSLDFYFDLNDRNDVIKDLEETGKSYREIRLKSPVGDLIWSIFSLVTTEIAGEAVIIGGLYDITNRRAMEEELRRERNFISAVLRTAGALVVVLDREGKIVQFNRACEQISGYSADEAIGRCVWDFLLPEDAVEPVKRVFEDIKNATFSGTVENYWLTRGGDKRLIEWQNTELMEEDGELQYVIATGIDITEKRMAEDALRNAHAELEERVERRTQQLAESEALNRAIIEALPDMIFRFDKDGTYLDVKAPEGSPLFVGADRLLGHKPDEFLSSELAEYLMSELSIARETGAMRIVEYSLPIDGSDRHLESRLVPYGDHEVMAIVRDVTDEVEAKEALQKAHDQLEERVDLRTRELAGVNEALRQEVSERRLAQDELSSRLRYEEALANCSQVLMAESNFDVAVKKILRHLRNASNATTAYIFENYQDSSDGLCCRLLQFDCEDELTATDSGGWDSEKVPYAGVFARWREVLSKGDAVRATTAELPEIEKSYFEPHGVKALLAIPIFVNNEWHGFIGFEDTRIDRDWREDDVRALRTASEILGVSVARKRAEDALRLSEERFRNIVENANDIIFLLNRDGDFSYVSPNWSAQLGHAVNQVIGQSLLDFVHPSDLTECRDCLREMLQTLERQYGLEYRVRHQDGDWRWHTISISPMTSSDGDLISYVCVSHDVTEQKRTLDELAEAYKNLKQTQGQLIQSEKMASLGMLVAGIAHEINTPTGAVVSMHNTLMRALTKLQTEIDSYCTDPGQQEQLRKTMQIIDDANKVIVSGTDRVTNIVRRLRSFARLDEAESKTVNIHDGLEDTLTLIHHEIKHEIEIVRDFGQLPQISCYPGRLNQVFLNLLINAKQAIGGKGTITIRTRSKGDNVVVEFSDSGAGIPAEHLDRIFDPGFTTKGVGVGTGLGLSICYQIIQDHQGTIVVASELGKGTTFTVTLPVRPDFGVDRKSDSDQK